jgi:rSAM/selenodomain-associated transferase 1
MAKEPLPGRVLPRLTPPLSPGMAAALYRAFLLDVLETTATVARADLFAFVHPAAAIPWFRENGSARFEYLPQSGALLSERMIAVFAELFRRGYGAVVMRNSESPTLPARVVSEALDALEKGRDFALGPDLGGGYCLVGMRRPHPELFRGMAAGATSVLDETRRRARSLGLAIHEAPRWLDVDVPDDLARLREQLDPARRAERATCDRTEAMLATLPRLQLRAAAAGTLPGTSPTGPAADAAAPPLP